MLPSNVGSSSSSTTTTKEIVLSSSSIATTTTAVTQGRNNYDDDGSRNNADDDDDDNNDDDDRKQTASSNCHTPLWNANYEAVIVSLPLQASSYSKQQHDDHHDNDDVGIRSSINGGTSSSSNSNNSSSSSSNSSSNSSSSSSNNNSITTKHLIILSLCYNTIFIIGMTLSYLPWFITYYHYTGRLTPNAWPSEKMKQTSSFIRHAINKPYYTYLLTLIKISSTHLIPLMFTIIICICIIIKIIELYFLSYSGSKTDHSNDDSKNDDDKTDNNSNNKTRYMHKSTSNNINTNNINTTHPDHPILIIPSILIDIIIFAVWPLAFLVGLTILGNSTYYHYYYIEI
jgi:hypothetical protein